MTALDQAAYALHLAQKRKGGLLQWGSRNPRAVKALQNSLTSLGYTAEADGQWGKETENAFRAFQQSAGLKVDGKLGPKSLAQLLKAKPKDANAADPGLDAISKVVTPEAHKAQTEAAKGKRNAQSALGEAKAEQRGGGASSGSGASRASGSTPAPVGPHGGAIDPATGAETATAKTGPIGTTDPNKAHTPRADPQAQPVDQEFENAHPRASGGPTGGQFAKKGDTSPEVGNTQAALNAVDKAGLAQDQQFGDKTEKAVKGFQKANGLQVDGIVGPATSGALRRKLNAMKQARDPLPAEKPAAWRPARVA